MQLFTKRIPGGKLYTKRNARSNLFTKRSPDLTSLNRIYTMNAIKDRGNPIEKN